MSVVKPVLQIFEPDDLAPGCPMNSFASDRAMDQMGNIGERLQSYFRAVKRTPPAALRAATVSCNLFALSLGLFAFLPQPGSLKTPWIVADSELILAPTVAREQANALEDRGLLRSAFNERARHRSS